MSPQIERVAAIDVGSNTILLLIAEYDPSRGIRILEESEDQPRLGAGLGRTGRLSQEAMDRALQSLVRMKDLCRTRRVTRLRAVATAAVREAENGPEFVRRARDHDIQLETISPETEASLAYRSAAYHFPGSARMLVADIGGATLELIGASQGEIELIQSLPLGAVRLTELALPLLELQDRVRRALRKTIRDEWAGSQLIGSGGTFATAAAMSQARTEITSTEMNELLGSLSRMSPEERRRVPGLRPERADIIVAGMAVAVELLERVSAPSVKINAYGLREGLLLEMLNLDQPHSTTW